MPTLTYGVDGDGHWSTAVQGSATIIGGVTYGPVGPTYVDIGAGIKQDILKIGIRKLERDTGVSHHTLDKILRGEHVRRKTLAKIMQQIQAVQADERLV